MLRIKPNENIDQGDSFIEVDQRRKQISMLQPKNLNVIPQKLQNPNNAPKLFAFDAIFEPDITQVYYCFKTISGQCSTFILPKSTPESVGIIH